MKLGVFTVLFANLPFERMLERVKSYGLDCIEVGTGGYPGNAHCDLDGLLADPARQRQYIRSIEGAGLSISALACQGNPLHPDKEIAEEHRELFRKTVLLAERLEVPIVNVMYCRAVLATSTGRACPTG